MARIVEWLTEKVDALSTKLKPEPKDEEEVRKQCWKHHHRRGTNYREGAAQAVPTPKPSDSPAAWDQGELAGRKAAALQWSIPGQGRAAPITDTYA